MADSNPTKPTTAPRGTAAQPLADIRWIKHDALSANSWNPNHQAPPEHRLLAISILENGWTQPIVARQQEDGTLEIVDGFHRWTLAGTNRKVADLTDGLVPVVVLPECPPDVARLATIRHNRARGTHHVLGMADIVAELLDMGLSPEEIGSRLQMDAEEVERLADRGNMLKRGSADSFGNGWKPTA